MSASLGARPVPQSGDAHRGVRIFILKTTQLTSNARPGLEAAQTKPEVAIDNVSEVVASQSPKSVSVRKVSALGGSH